ncbi:unnamed protein product [Natator depressus]
MICWRLGSQHLPASPNLSPDTQRVQPSFPPAQKQLQSSFLFSTRGRGLQKPCGIRRGEWLHNADPFVLVPQTRSGNTDSSGGHRSAMQQPTRTQVCDGGTALRSGPDPAVPKQTQLLVESRGTLPKDCRMGPWLCDTPWSQGVAISSPQPTGRKKPAQPE